MNGDFETIVKGKMYRQDVMLIFCLREMMNRKQATLISLSEASGVSVHTIQRAINGRPILMFNGHCLLSALKTKTFKRKRRLFTRKKLL